MAVEPAAARGGPHMLPSGGGGPSARAAMGAHQSAFSPPMRRARGSASSAAPLGGGRIGARASRKDGAVASG